jgi:FixJ family two-component response regulator
LPTQAEAGGAIVAIIDDDLAVREALGGLFQSIGLTADLHASVDAFLAAATGDRADCLVVDVRLPGKGGLEFIEELARAGTRRAIVFISGHADIPMAVRAMKAGAIDFLTKPVREQELLEAVQRAIQASRKRRAEEARTVEAHALYALLTQRERAVMAEVITGKPNRTIAAGIGISEATVKLHRSQIMRKMRAGSLIELVRLADLLAG